MGLKVIGAGVGRTGTVSLKFALQHLLGGRCYHMWEVFRHPGHVQAWHDAVQGREPDWDRLYDGFAATVDWPGAAFWQPLSKRYPHALVLLSVRESADEWFQSASQTIEPLLSRPPAVDDANIQEWYVMVQELFRATFTTVPFDREAAIAAYERHNADVRQAVRPDRLLEWTVGDGWEPICAKLEVPVPDIPFPRMNRREKFVDFMASKASAPSLLDRARRLFPSRRRPR